MTANVQNIESQLTEVDFLKSLYNSVKTSPHSVIEEFQAFVDGKLDDVYNQITCLITLDGVSPAAEVEVTLPHNYPHNSLRFLVAVRNYSYLNRKLQEFVATFQEEHEPGTFCVSFVIDFVKEYFESQPKESEPSIASNPSPLNRVWLLSHHIYDKVKRKNLLELSVEKNLGGFTLPGKPGVICLEGFEELSCYKATQGAGERPHMDLGVFKKYLEDHELDFAFQELFDVEAK